MQIQPGAYTFGSTFWEKAASATMGVVRSGVGLFTKARGDSENQIVTGAPTTNYGNLAVYGTLAALALIIVAKPSRGTK